MIRRALHNLVARLGTAGLNFAMVWLTARYLGATGRGAVSLFVTDCAILILFTGLLGGSSLIYLAPRRNVWHLLWPAYAWAVIVCTGGTVAISLLREVPPGYLGHLWGLSLLQAFFSINTSLLLGRKREKTYNVLLVLQTGLLAGLLLLGFVGLHRHQLSTYYWATYLAFGLPWLLSLSQLTRLPDHWATGLVFRTTVRELARHSRGSQVSNILAFVNYRLSYYFVAHFADTRALGILSVGVALAEAIWLIPRSLALVQYVDLVHAQDQQAPLAPILRAAHLALLATGVALAVLCTLPAGVLAAIFGAEFGMARPVILCLAPGVVAIAVNLICSTYFSGLAQYRVNNLATLAGLLVAVPACAWLVPWLGIAGAALASSASYLTSMSYLLWQFKRATGLGPGALLPRLRDLGQARDWLKKAGLLSPNPN